MNTPLPPIDPPDPHERELARILRALPGGEPPPALDARILRAAHDALAQPASRKRALWAGGSSGALWGIGSAAAAILAGPGSAGLSGATAKWPMMRSISARSRTSCLRRVWANSSSVARCSVIRRWA